MVKVTSRVLGWFSLGLGVLQLVAPGRLLSAIGIMPGTFSVAATRLIGMRELGVVPGLLTGSAPFGWLAARAAGDVADLLLLGVARGGRGNDRGRVTLAMAAVTGVLVVDVIAAVQARRDARGRSRHPGRIVRAVTVDRPAEELYRFWRDLENLPTVMPHLERVDVRDDGRSHWIASAPVGTVEWDAEIVEDRPGELLSWRSVEGSDVHHAGSVRFAPAPAGRGTEVTVEMEVETPGGPIGSVVAVVTGEDPRQQVSDALRRFKQVIETGEPIRSAGTAHGRKILQRPARPVDARGLDPSSMPVGVGSGGDTGNGS